MLKKRGVVSEVIQVVRDFYRIGVESLRERPKRGGYAAGETEREARKHGMNPDTLRKARTFADPSVGYSATEVDELCESIAASWDNFVANGANIGRTHIIRLLGVQKARGKRDSIQNLMFRRGWSTAELEGEIRRRFGRRKRGGRRADIGRNLHELIGHLDSQCEAWLRLDGQLASRQEEGVRPTFKDLSPPVCSLVNQITKGMRGLRTAIDAQRRPASASRG
jgi:hypothetical protein